MSVLKYKDDHNKIAYLGRERGCEDFTDILSYLDQSPLRFLQMIVALETADRTPRPTFDLYRKMFANMKFKWVGQPIPLYNPPSCHCCCWSLLLLVVMIAAIEDNAAANYAAGSAGCGTPDISLLLWFFFPLFGNPTPEWQHRILENHPLLHLPFLRQNGCPLPLFTCY
ncbi:hypothetical protein Tco_1092543 [Tanacetum coccineum]|uniref:Uncharacterized protein n=1 Tax=Tanacetum coccineum TaxID=301880 RepID=A0ABQ5IA63_9ASTR